MVYVEVKVNRHGQILIPKPIREAYDIEPGGEMLLVEKRNELVVRPKKKSASEFAAFLQTLPKKKVGAFDADKEHEEELARRWST